VINSRCLLAIAAALVLVSGLTPAGAQPVAARDGGAFVTAINEYRAEAGVPALQLHPVVDAIAVERANQLAADRALGHDLDYVVDRLDEEGVCWVHVGENVAYNTAATDRVARFVRQWYDSDGHRALMLGSTSTHAGASWQTGSDGRHYAVALFVRLCGGTPPSYGGFTDIADSKFRDDIVWLAEQGITTGCATNRFCPRGLVLRDQMATFLTRAMSLPAASRDWFVDDAANVHEDGINRIADAAVTRGCAARSYCPGEEVSRGQMASFLARALELPATSLDFFRDDDGSAHEDAINRMAAAGITYGCDTDRFCPRASVKREQMAAFLRRAYD
jgi:Cysteine-rich secretory protein family/S-layer homology domain